MKTLEQQVWEGETGRQQQRKAIFLNLASAGVAAGILALISLPSFIRDYKTSHDPRPKTMIFEEDRDGDGIPEYVRQDLVDGKYQTTKILKGYLDEKGNVKYDLDTGGYP